MSLLIRVSRVRVPDGAPLRSTHSNVCFFFYFCYLGAPIQCSLPLHFMVRDSRYENLPPATFQDRDWWCTKLLAFTSVSAFLFLYALPRSVQRSLSLRFSVRDSRLQNNPPDCFALRLVWWCTKRNPLKSLTSRDFCFAVNLSPRSSI